MSEPLLTFTDRGIFCTAGDFHIDPWRPVPRAVITHAHSDHARAGSGAYLATPGTAAVMRHRLGSIRVEELEYGRPVRRGDVTVSFHPAGHVPGSAQIRVERGGEVWVVSGDYKVAADGLSEPFEPVACHTFISECTFGLPVFRWEANATSMARINDWWARNATAGRPSLIGAYALGKAQRILAGVDHGLGPVLTHGAVEPVNAALRAAGYALPATRPLAEASADELHRALVIAPPGALGSAWARRLGDAEEAAASGWMAIRGIRRRRGLGTGFVISDHADFPGLNAAIRATGAERVFVTHGYTAAFRRWLADQGYDAGIVTTEYHGETADPAPETDADPAAGDSP